MKLHFHKYHGTGNDFILIDDRNEKFPIETKLIKSLCDRRFGIGADGLILIQNHAELDYLMVYFNADGSQSLCGNGSRCGFQFARDLGIVSEIATFQTTDGIHNIKVENDLIHFQLFDTELPKQLSENEWYLDTGSPHHICFSQNVNAEDVLGSGKKIRDSLQYSGQNGTNVNFAQVLQGYLKIRTYERGVEGETLSCGTGATAVAILAGFQGMKSPVEIETRGGKLTIFFERKDDKFTNIWLAGPAIHVFKGTTEI